MGQLKDPSEMVKTVRPYPVSRLYKYRSMQSRELEGIFLKRQVYLADPTRFNDPFECSPYLTVDPSSIKRELYLKQITKDSFPNASKGERKRFMKGKGVKLVDRALLKKSYSNWLRSNGMYCLSEKKDDILMWAHYSDAHRGLCLEFDTSKEGTLFWQVFKVQYQDDYPEVNMINIGEIEEFRKTLLTKSRHWEYEKEWRILKTDQEGGPGFYPFSPELLTGVICGALMSDNDKDLLKDWIRAYPTTIKLYQAELNERKYQIDVRPLA
jgi:hypothetical protein